MYQHKIFEDIRSNNIDKYKKCNSYFNSITQE